MSTNTSSNQRNPLARLFLFVLAFTVMPFYEGAKWLSNKVYRGWEGALRALIGMGLGITAGISAGHCIGWQLGHSAWLWLPGGLLSFLLTFSYAWPLVYLWPVKPLLNLCEKFGSALRKLAQNQLAAWTDAYINLIRKLPLAEAPWAAVLKKGRDSWVMGVLYAVSYISIVLGCAYLAWSTFGFVHGAVHLGVVSYLLGGIAGLAAALFALTAMWTLLDYGKIPVIAMGSGAILIHTFAARTAALVAHTGADPIFNWLAYAVEFLLYTAYVFPIGNLVLTNGFWKWLIDEIKPLTEKVYDESQGDYRAFFHQSVGLAATWRFTTLSLVLCAALGLHLPATIAVAALVAVLSYTLVPKLIDHDAGNALIGVVFSGHAAWFAGKAYLAAGLWYGVYGAIPAGVAAGIVAGTVVFPALYLLLKAVANPLLASWLSKPLVAAHKWVWTGFQKLVEKLSKVYEYSYKDKAPFRDLFIQAGNLAVAAVMFVATVRSGNALGLVSVLTYALAAVAVFLSYTLIGKLLTKVGMEAYGVVLSLSAAIWAGSFVYPVSGHGVGSVVVTAVAALAAGNFVAWLAFPIAYVVLSFLTGWALTPWLLPLLSGLYGAAWKLFAGLWKAFLSVYNLAKNFIAPYWQALVRLWTGLWKSVMDAWKSITHRR